MTTGLYFLKLELNYLKDSKFNTLLSESQRWRYVQLYMLAKELNAEGSFVRQGTELSLADIAWYLHIDAGQLQQDMDAIRSIGLICENGHGPCLVRFVQEQETPRSDAERKQDQRSRDADKSRSSHEPVTNRVIKSELKIKSQSQSQDIESSVRESAQQPTDDDRVQTDSTLAERKAEICKHAGIPPRFSRGLITQPQITPEDLLAELARNHSRKDQVKNPGYISGQNLSRDEKPSAEWYEQGRWLTHLPSALKSKLGLGIQGAEEEVTTSLDVAIRHSPESETPTDAPGYKAWQNVVELLKAEMSPGNHHKYLGSTHLVDYEQDVVTVRVWGPDKEDKRDWLESRLTSTATRLLQGICNRQVQLRFTVEGGES